MSDETEVRVNFGKPMPIFPLGAVTLLPHRVMPYLIFEPRYRQMVEDAIDGPGQIAVAVFEGDAWRKDYMGTPPIREVVCVGQITRHQKLPDGRFHIALQGVCRARIVEEFLPEAVSSHSGTETRPDEDADESDESGVVPGETSAAKSTGGDPSAEQDPAATGDAPEGAEGAVSGVSGSETGDTASVAHGPRLYRTALLQPIGVSDIDEDSLDPYRQQFSALLTESPLSGLKSAPDLAKYLENDAIPTSAIMELLTESVLHDARTGYYPELHYTLLAEPDATRRAQIILAEMNDLRKLLVLAGKQRQGGDTPPPRGCNWN